MKDNYNSNTSEIRERVFSTKNSNQVHKNFLRHIGKTQRGGKILDIGTGNGYILEEIQRKFPGDYPLFGVDLSYEMLEVAKGKNINADLQLADNFNLPFGPGYFSTVTAKNVTRFSPKEIARVLKNKGLFVFREYGKSKGLMEVAECFPERLIRSRDPDYYTKSLSNAGFTDICVRKYELKRKYSKEELGQIVRMFPFIKNFGNADLKTIDELFKINDKIAIASDPFILTARRKSR